MTLALHRDYNTVIGQIMGNDMRVIFGHEQCCLPAQCPLEIASYCRFLQELLWVFFMQRGKERVWSQRWRWWMGVFDGHAEGQSLYLHHLQCHSGHPPSRAACLQQLIFLLSGGYGFCPRPFVLSDGRVRVRVVCQQDYTQTTERISTKPRWELGFGPKKTPLHLVWIQDFL